MPRLLMMEGNTKESRDKANSLAVRWASKVYEDAVLAEFPDLTIDTVLAADPGVTLPADLSSYDGMIVGGSGLHSYDTDFAVTNQIQLLKQFAETGKPILGSCWGLQIAVIAEGGSVALSPNGREIVFARKISLVARGAAHPFMAGRSLCFDAPCIHYDEVSVLPAGAELLCTNDHSQVQGAIVPVGKSEVWAVQYHPEFDLHQLSMLLKLYGDNMLDEGFMETQGQLDAYRAKLDGLAQNPENKALAWQLGIDRDILDDGIRRTEIANWVRHKILV